METEKWIAVPGFEGFYEVSNLGNVKSVLRVDCAGRIRYERILKGGRNKRGYKSVSLYKDKASKCFRVSRLVLMAFIGQCPEGMEAAHNNGETDDNRLSNLRWDTHIANCADKKQHGTDDYSHQQGEKSYLAKLTEENVRLARSLATQGVMQKDIAAMMGVNKATMNYALRGKTWGHVS